MIVMARQKEQRSEDGTPPEERLQEGIFLSAARGDLMDSFLLFGAETNDAVVRCQWQLS